MFFANAIKELGIGSFLRILRFQAPNKEASDQSPGAILRGAGMSLRLCHNAITANYGYIYPFLRPGFAAATLTDDNDTP